MGTRGLTAVVADGSYRIAQYGQWDHYPSGQGVTVRDFLVGMNEPHFRAQLAKCRWITEEEIDTANEAAGIAKGDEWITMDQSTRFYAQPAVRFLTRDHGAQILQIVNDAPEDTIRLLNSIDFAGDSLFCEYAYVVDFDKRTFEVYKGFNKAPVPNGERFAKAPLDEDAGGYQPIRLLATFSLDALPSEDEFLAACGVKENT